MQPAKRLTYEPDPNKFDLRTHHWDGQGNLTKKNLYTCHVVNGNSFFERPIKSGNLWYENNQPAGRVTYDDKGVKTIDTAAAHIAFVPKLEGDDALFYELEQQKNETAALKAELAAIKAETAAKVAPAAAPAPKAESAAPTLRTKGAPDGK